MSDNRMSAAKRKASDVDLDSEDVGFFPYKLNTIITARPRRPACSERVLKTDKPADTEAAADLVLPTEQIDVSVVKLILPSEKVDIGVDSNNLTDGDEGCKTPKSVDHRIPKILTCPPAPRKPRPTARLKTESTAALCRTLFVNPSDLDFLFCQKPKKF